MRKYVICCFVIMIFSSVSGFITIMQTTEPNPQITYHGDLNDGRVWEIYVMDSDGGNRLNLSNSVSSVDVLPMWSPDGERILFQSDRDGNREIYVVDIDGDNLTNLTNHEADDFNAVWSPDGSRIAFVSSRQEYDFVEIYIMNADGSDPVQVTDHSDMSGSNSYLFPPAWSPDGTHFAYIGFMTGDRDVYIADSDGSNPINVSFDEALTFDANIAWSPDSTQLAFNSYRDGEEDIYVVNADGTNLTRITNTTELDEIHPQWSPDGTQILVQAEDRDYDIYVMDIDGSNMTQLDLSEGIGSEQMPRWSSDGAQVLFLSSRDSFLLDIFVMNADGTDVINLTNTINSQEGFPSWRPQSE